MTNVFVVRVPKIFRSAPSCIFLLLLLFTNKWLSDFALFIVYPTFLNRLKILENELLLQLKNSLKIALKIQFIYADFVWVVFFFFVLSFVYYRLCLYLLLDFCTRRTWLRYFFHIAITFHVRDFLLYWFKLSCVSFLSVWVYENVPPFCYSMMTSFKNIILYLVLHACVWNSYLMNTYSKNLVCFVVFKKFV